MTAISEETPRDLLIRWLVEAATEDGMNWLIGKIEAVTAGDARALYLSFGMAPRKIGKSDLALSEEELILATAARAGWDPRTWSIDQAARTLLILAFPSEDTEAFVSTLDRLFQAGDVGELVALYQALPLLPHPGLHQGRAAEGVRSSIRPVVCAVAHRNPYPAEQFSEGAWNQMVLKCLFVEAPLCPVLGLEARANAELTRMLCDYAHERWAAGRQVSPELWRPVGLALSPEAIADLQHVLAHGTEIEQKAAALALASADLPDAEEALNAHPDLYRDLKSGGITWEKLETYL